ncbi:MAG: folylpolyglutamate synthase/dihydrofolate synthase family protein [Bacteroidia bacterium]
MNYQQTVDYLYSQLPAFTRIGAAAYKADLGNILALCEALKNPQETLKTIHVAGTNGKGSSSHFLASILQEAGYKTGLFTSPHLKDFRERFRVNGEMVEEDFVVEFVKKNSDLFEKIQPSFFEMTVALAFSYFNDQKVDIAVIETGLGGRLDSTNIIKPEISLITNIDYDHMDLLGDTLEKIAFEKAGIIKFGIPTVISEFQEGLDVIFNEKANINLAPIIYANKEVHWSSSELIQTDEGLQLACKGSLGGKPIDLISPLIGGYQAKNLKGVIVTMEVLKKSGWTIPIEAVYNGIKNVKRNTSLLGRWQNIGHSPEIYCDTGHNTAGIREILLQLKHHQFKNLHIVFGVVKDKNIDEILMLLPKEASYYFCAASIFRALSALELLHKASQFGLKGNSYNSVNEALESAKSAAEVDDFIYIGGSTFVVAEII